MTNRHQLAETPTLFQNSIVAIDADTGVLCFTCPHCGTDLQVEPNQINCGIFRCGIVRSTGAQIAPHASEQECDALRTNEGGTKIWGCARPFRLVNADIHLDNQEQERKQEGKQEQEEKQEQDKKQEQEEKQEQKVPINQSSMQTILCVVACDYI